MPYMHSVGHTFGLKDLASVPERGANSMIQEECLSHLPEGSESVVARLKYLTLFSNSLAQCPFTIEQEAIFLAARKWEKINGRSLKLGLWLCTALSIAPGLLGLNKIQDWENSNPQNASTMFIIVTLYAGAIGMINYICTGTLPDKAAMASIKATAEVIQTRKMYEEIALRLLEIYGNDSVAAKALAGQIHVSNIKTAMRKLIPSEVAEDICSALSHAKSAVLADQLVEGVPPLVRSQWQIIKLAEQVKQIEAHLKLA